MRTSVSIVAVLLFVLIAIPQAHAQTSHAAPQSALDAALEQHVNAARSQREDVLRVLAHPEVQAVASEIGFDLRRATSAVATLEGTELVELAAQAHQVEQALAGGQSRVVVSTTLIIIALLVLILIIVAVR